MLALLAFLYVSLFFIVLLESRSDFIQPYGYYNAAFIYFYIVFIAVIKPIGLGYDDINYYFPLLDSVHPYLADWEIGYVSLYKVLRQFSLTDFGTLSGVIVAISMFNNIKAIKFFSPYLNLSILLYLSHLFIYKEFTQMRFAIASSFCMLSFYFLYKGNYKLYVASILFAVTFHLSAIVAFLTFFIVKINVKKILILVLMVLCASILNVFDNLIIYFGGHFFSDKAFATYLGSTSIFSQSLGLLNPTTIKYLLILTYASYLCVYTRAEHKMIFLTKIYSLAPLWIITFSSFGTLAGRPAVIFSAVECIILAYFCCSQHKINTLLYKLALVFLSMLLLYTNLFVKQVINIGLLL